jgi:hypothetical protein
MWVGLVSKQQLMSGIHFILAFGWAENSGQYLSP